MRFVWFKIKNVPLKMLQEEMLKREYKPGNRSGFRIQECKSSQVVGRYIVSDIVVDKITDPFGDIHEYQREVFEETRFRIASGFPELELIDPPRRQNAFLSALSVASQFKISIEPVRIDLRYLIKFFSEMHALPVVKEIIINGIKPGGKVVYKLQIKSDNDVRTTANEIGFIQKPVWEAMKFVTEIYGRRFSFKANQRGRITVNGKEEFELCNILRNGIRKSNCT